MAVILLAALLAACSGPARRAPAPVGSSDPGSVQPAPDPVRMRVVFTAMQQVGVPYRWGGSTPAGFDCSGLVQYAYQYAGLRLPRTAAEQLTSTTPVTLENAAPGDLLFFRDGGRTSHVAIYIGEGRFVHAPRGGKTVSLDTFDNTYWRTSFTRAGRIIPL